VRSVISADLKSQINLTQKSDKSDVRAQKGSLSLRQFFREQTTMIDIRVLDEIANRLMALMPADLATAKEDVEKNVKSVLQTGLRKLDLVTREEFDVQRAVLLRTREKLEALEAKIAAMEASAGA
jgi:ubiquinone biosynthesis accessory factor UbiK